jgi:Flp pilus assembly protein TadG
MRSRNLRPFFNEAPVHARAPIPDVCRAATWRLLKSGEGSGLVEYAVVLLIFMTMILGIIDFGRVLYAYHFVSHASKTAARWAAVNGYNCTIDNSCNGTLGMNNGRASATDIQTYVTNLAPDGIDNTGTGCGGNPCMTTTVNWPVQAAASADPSPLICSQSVGGVGPYNNYPGCTVQVQVSYAFKFLFPFIYKGTTACGSATANLCLSSTSEMVISH